MKQRAPSQARADGPTASTAPAGPELQAAGNAAAMGELGAGMASTPTPMLDAAAAETATPADTSGGLTITSETAWAAGDGSASSRTTVAPGEMVYFTASDPGGTWTSTSGTGTDAGGIYNWTARQTGSVTITYTKGTQRATMTLRVIPPSGFGVVSTAAQSFGSGQGAGMDVFLRVLPNTVSWGGIEVMEQVGTVAGSGYFTGRTIPHDPEPWAGVSETNETGPDDASFSGWPSPWREGTMTWTIPTEWRLLGGRSGGVFTTSTQAMRIHDTTGRSSVTKFGTPSTERTP